MSAMQRKYLAPLDDFELWEFAHAMHAAVIRTTQIEMCLVTTASLGDWSPENVLAESAAKQIADDMSALLWEVEAEQMSRINDRTRSHRFPIADIAF